MGGVRFRVRRYRLDVDDNLLARKHNTQVRVLLRAIDGVLVLLTAGKIPKIRSSASEITKLLAPLSVVPAGKDAELRSIVDAAIKSLRMVE